MSDTGLRRSPKVLKGALVEFSERFLGPIPNIIVFQYNFTSLTRTLEGWQPPADAEGAGASETTETATAQPEDPTESFDLELYFDAADDLEQPESHPVAVVSGVAARIAAVELLLYPDQGSLLGELLGSITASVSAGGASIGGGTTVDVVPRTSVPVVLLVLGPRLIAPVRVTTFRVEEQTFSPLLYPIQAKVTLGVKILRPDELAAYKDGFGKDVAKAAYELTKKQKQVLGAANLANSVESILGMLPF